MNNLKVLNNIYNINFISDNFLNHDRTCLRYKSKNKRRQTEEVEKKAKITNQTLSAGDVDKLGNKYIVIKGDNISIIARKNNTTSAKLMQLNNFSGAAKIKPGQVLIVK